MPDIKEASEPSNINLPDALRGRGLYHETPSLRVRTDRVSAEEQAPEKIAFSDKVDFKFTAAYEAYSKAFDEAELTVKGELNETITKLHDGKMDYGLFYNIINQHIQGADKGSSFRRARIEGQRKQEYAKDERKRGRNERYRG
jgi:hypothetical protein